MIGKGLLGFILSTVAAVLGRIFVAGALLAAVVSFGLIQFRSASFDPLGGLRSLGTSGSMNSLAARTGGLDRLAQLLPSGGARYETISVRDVSSEIERRRAARDAYVTSGGALIVPIDR